MKLINVRGEDFAALHFEEDYKNMKVSDFINIYFDKNNIIALTLTTNCVVEIELLDFNNIDFEFVKFIRNNHIDYDLSKNTNFYLENELI